MPASSKRQQHFFGMVHALQKGAISSADLPAGVREKVKKTAKGISKKASGEFAKSVEEYFTFPALTFKEYLVVESELMEAIDALSEEELAALVEAYEAEETSAAAKIVKGAVARGGKEVKVRDSEEDEETEGKWETKHKARGEQITKTPHKEIATKGGKTTSVWHEDEEKAAAEKDVKAAVARGGKQVRFPRG